MEYKIGDIIGSYSLTAFCGAGAYGKVFLAENNLTKYQVALKIISFSTKTIDREMRGLINFRDCRHPNLLQIHHIDKIDGGIYYTMELADNAGTPDHYIPDTLAFRLEQHKHLPAADIIAMCEGLLDGLTYLHQRQLVHRDIKPENIFWVHGVPTLGDIGLTSPVENASLIGTPGFMSEELMSGKRHALPQDDLYALGKVIYCSLTGCMPGEFPHYPENITISDASSLIKTYTKVCQSPCPIKSTQEMKSLLNSAPVTKKASSHWWVKSGWGFAIGGLLLIIVLSCWSIVTPVQKRTSRQPINLEQLYCRRSDALVQETLELAYNAREKMYQEIQKSLGALKRRPMNHDKYVMIKKIILQNWDRQIQTNPLCALANQEDEIQEFLAQNKTNVSVQHQKKLNHMLNNRDKLLAQIQLN